uniref:Uncharacterized protein n=1 Tax=Lymantria dispar multicapsid nuclear polyhedrosis virus TaxID=10449 RepID=A0A1B1MR74_NPVLD|nr:hypothetical protein [Lymantria dispar multiple nucleopolyhedrovirus]
MSTTTTTPAPPTPQSDEINYFNNLTDLQQMLIECLFEYLNFCGMWSAWSMAESAQANEKLDAIIEKLNHVRAKVYDPSPAKYSNRIMKVLNEMQMIATNLIKHVTKVKESRSIYAGHRTPNMPKVMASVVSLVDENTAAVERLMPELLSSNIQKALSKIVEWGGYFNEAALQEFKFEAELADLLKHKIVGVSSDDGSGGELAHSLTRFDCAAIVTQALFFYNKPKLDLKNMLRNYKNSKIVAVKLLCLLQYIRHACHMIRYNGVEFSDDTVSLLVVDAKKTPPRRSVALSPTRAVSTGVEMKIADPAYRFTESEYPAFKDLAMIYSNGSLGAFATQTRIDQEEVLFLKCPELYALSEYAPKRLTANDSLVLVNLQQFNNVITSRDGNDLVYESTNTDAYIYRNFMAINNPQLPKTINAQTLDDLLTQTAARYSSGLDRFGQYLQQHQQEQQQQQQEAAATAADERSVLYTGVYSKSVPKKKTMVDESCYYLFLIEWLVCSLYEYDMRVCANNVETHKKILGLKTFIVDTGNVKSLFDSITDYVVHSCIPKVSTSSSSSRLIGNMV